MRHLPEQLHESAEREREEEGRDMSSGKCKPQQSVDIAENSLGHERVGIVQKKCRILQKKEKRRK